MNIFDIFKKAFKRSVAKNSDWAKIFGGGNQSRAGVRVDEETAMKYSAYLSGIRLIAETIASLPLNTYENLKERGKRKASDHRLYYLLHDQPNEDMSSFIWRETAKVHILGWGNHYSLIKRNPVKRYVEEIYPIEPWRVKPEIAKTSMGRIKYYRYQPEEGPEINLNSDNILHIQGLSYNGLVGITPLTWYREQIGLGLAMEEYSSKFFSSGMNAGGVFSTPQVLKEETYNKLKKELQEKYSGLGNAHNTMLLEQDLKFDKISINPNDAQLLESKKFQISEIARVLRIPLPFLQTDEPISDNNIEHLGIHLVVYCLLPWMKRDEQAYNMQLFPENEKGKYFTKYIVDGLLRGDTKTRFEAYTKAIQNGIFSPNDVLEMEDRNPYEGGDKHFIQLNMQPVENIENIMEGRDLVISGNEVRVISQKTREVRAIETRDNKNLTEKLQKAYEPLFVNSLIRIIKREKTDVLKIIRNEYSENDIEEFYEKHSLFVKSQLHPAIYSFSESLYQFFDTKDEDEAIKIVSIFSEIYSEDLSRRYVEENLIQLKKLKSEEMASKFDQWLETVPGNFSKAEMKKISKAFKEYIETISV